MQERPYNETNGESGAPNVVLTASNMESGAPNKRVRDRVERDVERAKRAGDRVERDVRQTRRRPGQAGGRARQHAESGAPDAASEASRA